MEDGRWKMDDGSGLNYDQGIDFGVYFLFWSRRLSWLIV